MSSEVQDRRPEIKTVVWLLHFSCLDALRGQHPNRMRGDMKEAPVIATQVREPPTEVPVTGSKAASLRLGRPIIAGTWDTIAQLFRRLLQQFRHKFHFQSYFHPVKCNLIFVI